MKTARAASRPIRAIPVPLGAALSRYNANTAAAQSLVLRVGRVAPIGQAAHSNGKMNQRKSLRPVKKRTPRVADKSQTRKELANMPRGAYLWRVTNSDRVRAAGLLID
jgi:hypothetical protein